MSSSHSVSKFMNMYWTTEVKLTPLSPLRASRESPPIQEKKKSTIWQLWDSAFNKLLYCSTTRKKPWIKWNGKTQHSKVKPLLLLLLSLSIHQLCTSLQLIVQPSTYQAAVLQRQHPLQVSVAGWFLSATQPHHVSDLHLQPHTGVLPRRVSSNQQHTFTSH